METEVKRINFFSLKSARKLILKGDLVAFPTETVYGLGANAFDQQAVLKIFEAKGRPVDNPLIVHIADKKMINCIAKEVNSTASKIIDAFMPGSITVVLKKQSNIPDCVTAGLSTVAVRLPKSKEARKFISACGVPIAAPSANTSGRPSPTTAEEVFSDLKGRIPLILKGKKCDVGIESTVVDCTGETPVILRPGIVTQSMLEEVIGKKVDKLTDTTVKVNSPGTRYRHYAPSCPCVLNLDGQKDKIISFYEQKVREGHNPVVLTSDDQKIYLNGLNVISLGKDEYEAAQNLYSTLRKAEKVYDFLIIIWTSKSEFAASVLDRLIRVTNKMFI
jgi:L-threonylcarbamoyladenylate synthase